MINNAFYDLGGFNTQLFYIINGIHAGWYDQFMILGSLLAKYRMFPIYLLIIMGIAWYDLARRKSSLSTSYALHKERWLKTIAVLIASFLVELVWVTPMKDYFHFLRPFAGLPKARLLS